METFLPLVMVGTLGLGCGAPPQVQPSPTPGFCSRSPEQVQATRQKFFHMTKAAVEVTAAREAFLKKPFQDVLGAIDLNLVRHDHQPLAPQVGQYEPPEKWGVVPSRPVSAIKFPIEFYKNIPEAIKQAVAGCNVNSLDLHFIIQSNNLDLLCKSKNVQLVTHHWAYPNIPIHTGTIFNRDLLMGIYDSDHDISKQIVVGKLKPFPVHIHDNAFSPNTAGLNITEAMLDFSFWSVVMDPETKRASVTLHWMIERDHFAKTSIAQPFGQRLWDAFKAKDVDGVMNLGTMIRHLDAHSSFFQNTPMLQKLQNLTRLN